LQGRNGAAHTPFEERTMTQPAAERQALARELLVATEPDEMEFFGEYIKAIDQKAMADDWVPNGEFQDWQASVPSWWRSGSFFSIC
jgi:hypothetical protein